KLSDDKGLFKSFGDNIYFVIWTTTTWTLPGNMAICLGPDITYALAKTPEGEIFILAKDLLEQIAKATGIEGFEVLAEYKGAELEFMKAKHPLYDRESLVILGDHVTLDAGTGAVHTAPGHGHEDFDVCVKYNREKGTNIEIIVPVDDKGHLNEQSGKYNGLFYKKANQVIQEDLQELGALVATEELDHQYAHCWRCKNPILYRATDQWFCSVDKFKDEAAAACDDVQWHPDWGHDRMVSMIRERNDWCISRQRNWGLPIPVFYCDTCKKPVCTDDSINSVSEIFAKEGSNAWFAKDAAELLPSGFTCPHCGGVHFYKETDTLDCWFDSGSTHIASLLKDEPHGWPADMYLEGADQYRGWFQSSLLVGVAVKGAAPYRSVLTHGWTVDGEGKAMHKSLGNSILPDEIIPKYGAELIRLWAASADYRHDVRCSDNIFKQLSETYLKIRNTARYILGNISDFNPDKDAVSFDDMLDADKWALVQLNSLVERCYASYEKYEFYGVIHAIHRFCVVEMSNFYLDMIKDRLYCEKSDGLLRRSGQTAIHTILDVLVKLLAPLLSFTANEIWLEMPHKAGDDLTNVMLNDMPEISSVWKFSEAEASRWEKTLALRADVNKALELARAEKLVGKPLDAKITLFVSEKAKSDIDSIDLTEIEKIFIVSEVELLFESGEGHEAESIPGVSIKVAPSEAEKCPRCWTRSHSIGSDKSHPELCERCAAVLK
ncbi:isoleucine--tRNA ligase, partial [Clostridiaceae bacterium OttesenSCG-928-D20]|nr:isoleucine--tRNA ligase [Clostridiaceae bacterium OttesenSCG-928-D20]